MSSTVSFKLRVSVVQGEIELRLACGVPALTKVRGTTESTVVDIRKPTGPLLLLLRLQSQHKIHPIYVYYFSTGNAEKSVISTAIYSWHVSTLI